MTEREEVDMWFELNMLAQFASLEYDRLHDIVSVLDDEPEAAIDELLRASEKERSVFFSDPFGFIPRKKRSTMNKRPSMTKAPQIPPRRPSSSPCEWKSHTKRPLVVSGEEKQRTPFKIKHKKYDPCEASSSASTDTREIPVWLMNVIREMDGDDARLVIEKKLTTTDVNRNHGRLSIPSNSIVDKNFLTAEEERMIEEKCRSKTSDVDVHAVLVDPFLWKWDVILRRWDMNTSPIYVFVSIWNSIVHANGFKAGDPIELWSFRSQGRLCFAFVPRRRA